MPAIVDPMDKGSMHFHRRLAELVRGNAKEPIRIAIYGDSNMTKDQISGELRVFPSALRRRRSRLRRAGEPGTGTCTPT